MELLLIRHAQSENNARPESERVEDPGITPLGVRQAQRLAEMFVAWDVEHLVASAFRRALLTAQQIQNRSGHTLTVWRHLHEVGGCYAGHLPGEMVGRPGMNAEELLAEFPQSTFAESIPATGWWSSKPYETDEQAWRRAQQQARQLLESFQHARRVACVIHADFKALMLKALLAKQWEQYQAEPLVNTGVTRLGMLQRLRSNEAVQ